MTTSQKSPRLLEGPLWVSGFIGFTLLIVCGAAYMGILREEAANPRARLFAELWPSVAVGGTSAEAVQVMGPPDVDEGAVVRPTSESDRAQQRPDGPWASDSTGCVRKLTWHSWQGRGSGTAYTVCVDGEGVVRDKTTGMVFQLTNW